MTTEATPEAAAKAAAKQAEADKLAAHVAVCRDALTAASTAGDPDAVLAAAERLTAAEHGVVLSVDQSGRAAALLAELDPNDPRMRVAIYSGCRDGQSGLPSDARVESVALAVAAGITPDDLSALVGALRAARAATIVLPRHRLENLSRGKGWCRKGKGSDVTWGARADGGYSVGPGRWIVRGNDGFARNGETEWDVAHIRVGAQTWTIAN